MLTHWARNGQRRLYQWRRQYWPQSLQLPCRCWLCGDSSQHLLCDACARDLPLNEAPCPRCALPRTQGSECPECLRRPPQFARSLAPYCYAPPLAGLINRWKHQGDQRLLPYLVPQLVAHLQTAYVHDDWPQCLLPVPIARARRLVRGFNQTEQLARRLGRQLQLPWRADLLTRRGGHSQQGLSRRERLRNLRQQFAVRGPLALEHVALIDDVMTTGATCATLAKILQDAGVKRVDIWMIARTP
ncbi:ComF family protein [Simiduia aestuariiviva]|uniref:ComF family protein n=1 Tax=Simiduia aestuariiviva TaxID=1510459 RepID=A0A839UK84_9GAMM|nr:ComF family protein [Simiduia aestuariiviva]MBB3167020.1 ComF family protein [Simiduia aestuariiviva]